MDDLLNVFLRKINFPAAFEIRLSDSANDSVRVELDDYGGNIELAVILPTATDAIREELLDMGYEDWEERSQPNTYTVFFSPSATWYPTELAVTLRRFIEARVSGRHPPLGDDVMQIDRLISLVETFAASAECDPTVAD